MSGSNSKHYGKYSNKLSSLLREEIKDLTKTRLVMPTLDLHSRKPAYMQNARRIIAWHQINQASGAWL